MPVDFLTEEQEKRYDRYTANPDSSQLARYFHLDDETYRRHILVQLNRREGRHARSRETFHGRRGELRQRYREGQEDSWEHWG